jgi:uncharacterized membrane protein YraQ (UPF0718 family)
MNIKELFENKEKIEKLQFEIKKNYKKNKSDIQLMKYGLLSLILTFVVAVYTGHIFKPETAALYFLITLIMTFLLSFLSDYISNKDLSRLEKEIFKTFDIKYNKDLHKLIKDNNNYLEAYIKNYKSSDIFLVNFINIIVNSEKEDLFKNQEIIQKYISEQTNGEVKNKLINIIEKKMNTKINKEEEKLKSLFKKEEKNKKIIKNL